MPTVVIPFAGVHGKTRLDLPHPTRGALSLAMLGDVLAAALALGPARVVTADTAGAALASGAGAEVVGDPGGGQAAAVAAGLAGVAPGAIVVLNADLPCVVPADLRALLAATPAGGLALVPARDGTTNALSLSAAELFSPVYGPQSARRFAERATTVGVECVAAAVPNLADDVDTVDDLRRLQLRVGPRTLSALPSLPLRLAS